MEIACDSLLELEVGGKKKKKKSRYSFCCNPSVLPGVLNFIYFDPLLRGQGGEIAVSWADENNSKIG